MSVAAWNAFLADTEADLDAGEAAVRNGSESPVPQWQPPTHLGPMPPEVRERTVSLKGRIDLLSTFVKYQLAALESDIAHVQRKEQRKGTNGKAIALFLDASV